jgi:hypothetical protein
MKSNNSFQVPKIYDNWSFAQKYIIKLHNYPEVKWKLKTILVYVKINVGSTKTNGERTMLVFIDLSNDNTATHLILLLHWQNAPKKNNDLWSDFYGQMVWNLLKSTQEWQSSMAITGLVKTEVYNQVERFQGQWMRVVDYLYTVCMAINWNTC